MAYYNLCDKCGCALDPGEKCDCEQVAQEKERRMSNMLFLGRNGQMTFNFNKEGFFSEKTAI